MDRRGWYIASRRSGGKLWHEAAGGRHRSWAKICSDISADQAAFVNRHYALAPRAAAWCARRYRWNLCVDDLLGVAHEGLLLAAVTYRHGTGYTERNWAFRRMRTKISQHIARERTGRSSGYDRGLPPLRNRSMAAAGGLDGAYVRFPPQLRHTPAHPADAIDVARLLRLLPGRSADVVWSSRVLGETYTAIGRRYGVSKSRADQILKESLKQLRAWAG
jgi:RNA polymerase sigma factor (sigma-70 family)